MDGNGWNLMKIALFTLKSPFGRQRPPKHQRNVVFCNTLRKGCLRGPLGQLFVNFIKCWKFYENHIKWWNSAEIPYFWCFPAILGAQKWCILRFSAKRVFRNLPR